MHTLLLENPSKLDRASLVEHAATLKLDVAAFEKALDAGTDAARLAEDVKAAQDAGLPGDRSTHVVSTRAGRRRFS